MSNKQEALDRLAQLEAKAKKLRDAIEKMPGHPEPKPGQVYRHETGSLYVAAMSRDGLYLMCLFSSDPLHRIGGRWDSSMFGGHEDRFTYIGSLRDLEFLTAERPNMSNKQEALDRLAQLEAEAKKLRAAIEKMPERPELKLGQVYRHEKGSLYMVCQGNAFGYRLMCIRGCESHMEAGIWCYTSLFDNKEDKFVYVGMIQDLATFNI